MMLPFDCFDAFAMAVILLSRLCFRMAGLDNVAL